MGRLARSMPMYVQQGTEDVATAVGPLRSFVARIRALRRQAGGQRSAVPGGGEVGSGGSMRAGAYRVPSVDRVDVAEGPSSSQVGTDRDEVAKVKEAGGGIVMTEEEDVTYVEAEGAYHDLIFDPRSPECLKQVGEWIQKRL